MKVSLGLHLTHLEFGFYLLLLVIFFDFVNIIAKESETSSLSNKPLNLLVVARAFLRGKGHLRLLLARIGRKRTRIIKFLTAIYSSRLGSL